MAFDDEDQSPVRVRKVSGFMLRAPQHAGTPASTEKPKRNTRRPPKCDVTIALPEAVHKLALAAAKRRNGAQGMTIETLCMQIITGVVCRGSVDGALRAWGDYQVDGRCGGFYKIATPVEPDEEPDIARE